MLNLKRFVVHIPPILLGSCLLALGALLAPQDHYLLSVLLVVAAIFLYFYISLAVAQRNWWDIRAVFSAIWILTTGLAALRLTNYQRQWETATWLIQASAYLMFYLGATLAMYVGKKLYHWIKDRKAPCIKGVTLSLNQNRLFWICFAVTLVGMACFGANVAIKGYIPYFSADTDAYLNFYTKFHVFAVAATMISALSYYTLKTQKLSLWKKIFLYFSIVYATFLFPMLVVSRGAFLTSALSLTTAIFYLNKKRFLSLVLCAAVIMVFYAEGTSARGYSDEQLNVIFEPSEIEINGSDDATGESGEPDNSGEHTAVTTFQLSGTAVFLYSYLTVSHDNFNEAVRLTESYTYGAHQLAPFNSVLKIDAIDKVLEDSEYHLVREHLNTVNLIGLAYYDFGAIGVALLMFLWAFLFGIIQTFYTEGKGPFALLALGNTMTPVTLCFFSAWMSVFSHWMHWGLAFILFLVACVTKVKSGDNNIMTQEETE